MLLLTKTQTHTHVGMCCATFSDDIRGVNTAAAGNPHQRTPTHRCLQDIWEASPLLLGPLLRLSSLLMQPCSFLLYSQEMVKKHAVCDTSMHWKLPLPIRGIHHSNTEICLHSVLQPIDVTDGGGKKVTLKRSTLVSVSYCWSVIWA